MDSELLKLVQQSIKEGITSVGWIFIAMSLLGAGLGAFLGSYFKRRGEDFAIRQNFENFIEQLKIQTKATEEIRAELSKKLEQEKSGISVWTSFRNEVIKDIWEAHRAVVNAMTTTILCVQQAESKGTISALETDLTEYRACVHRNLDLLTPEAVDMAQEFLGTAYKIAYAETEPNDANALKTIRHQFYQHMAQHFHLEEVLPWIIKEDS